MVREIETVVGKYFGGKNESLLSTFEKNSVLFLLNYWDSGGCASQLGSRRSPHTPLSVRLDHLCGEISVCFGYVRRSSKKTEKWCFSSSFLATPCFGVGKATDFRSGSTDKRCVCTYSRFFFGLLSIFVWCKFLGWSGLLSAEWVENLACFHVIWEVVSVSACGCRASSRQGY